MRDGRRYARWPPLSVVPGRTLRSYISVPSHEYVFIVVVARANGARRLRAFTSLPRGTVAMTLRIFPSAGKVMTVKRPEGRAPAALGWRAKHVHR
jgi:hypothetical protein